MSKLSDTNKATALRMFLVSRDLRKAYLLKEKFYEFMDSANSWQAKERLKAFHVLLSLPIYPSLHHA